VKGQPAIDFPAGGGVCWKYLFGRCINIHELININIDPTWARQKGSSQHGGIIYNPVCTKAIIMV